MGSSIAKIVEISSDADGGVDQLASAVLSDVALSQRILKMAAMAIHSGSAGSSVATVSRAIFVLGFEAVKTSALALLLVEGLADKRHAASVSREIAIALGASLVARRVFARREGAREEDEVLAALFKNLGSLLLASKDHGLYERVRDLVAGGETVGRASMEVLGCSLDQVAASAMRLWRLPEALVMAATGPAPRPGGREPSRAEWARQVAGASVEASAMISGGASEREAALAGWCAKHAQRMGVPEAEMRGSMARAAAEARALMGALGAGAIETVAASEAGAVGLDLPAGLLMDDAAARSDGPRRLHPSGKPFDAKDILLAGMGEATRMIASGQGRGMEVVMGILEALRVGMGLRLAIFCARDPRSGAYVARAALGSKAEHARAGFGWGAVERGGERDIFRLALDKGVDVTISDTGAEGIKSLLPDWHRALLPDAASFIVLPLMSNGLAMGLIYGDRTARAPEGVSADEAAMIRALKGQAIAVLARREARGAADKR